MMDIYYFSGTGNSLALARELADRLDAKIASIADFNSKDNISIEADCIGLVFPVYFALNDCGIPHIVQSFINKITTLKGKYIFVLCASEHIPWKTLSNTAKMIEQKGGNVSAEFIIYTSPDQMGDDLKAKFSKEKKTTTEYAEVDFSDEIREIAQVVSARAQHKFIAGKRLKRAFLILLVPLTKIVFRIRYRSLAGKKLKTFAEYVNHADNSFAVTDDCISCGTCKKVCPVANITMEGGRPRWNNKCENCLACYQYCPQNAIAGKIVEYNKRYHHPAVSVSDMTIGRKQFIK